MVARTPPKQKKMVAPLNPTLLRETVNKVDKCMARLQELQYTVAGGAKVISGVSLSPRSTRVYLRTSLRCKQESLRIKNANPRKSSPPGKLPTNTGDWRRMSLPAMLLGETVGEIMQASQFAREIVSVASKMKKLAPCSDDPKTPPVTIRRKQGPNPEENSEIRARRKREKHITLQTIRSESDAPTLHRARSRINFKVVSPPKKREQEKRENNANPLYLTNRVSPRNRPWAKKAVLFPNPLFHSSPTSQHHKFCKTKSPIIARNHRQTTPHKFLIKSPTSVKIKSPTHSVSPKRNTSLSRKSPKISTAAKIRRSFSPSRLANRLVSPLKGGRKSVQKSAGGVMSGLKQRPTSIPPMRFSARRAPF